MACEIKYIQSSQLSNTEKDRLNSLHLEIFQKAKEAKVFRNVNDRFQTVKNLYPKATQFIGQINQEYGFPVSKLLGIGNGNSILDVNVLPLANEKQGNIFLQNNVDYSLKAVSILQSPKADEIFRKGDKNNWNIDKILTELAVPKEQKELIKSFNTRNREEILTSLLASYTYTVEVNTAVDSFARTDLWTGNGNDSIPLEQRNTQHYSNLTVPGGTNYTENEIATPAITPSIKGHAQFATDKGIGWFRSDDKVIGGKVYQQEEDDYGPAILQTYDGELTKTRRILEVQSDLFQKGRDKKDLTIGTNVELGTIGSFEYNGKKISFNQLKNTYYSIENGRGKSLNRSEFEQLRDEYIANKPQSNENQFLQLLNKDNNWVTFFVKSIIQDSAKKGYEKVLFPSGDTASKVEGHTTLEEFKKQKEDRIKEINELKANPPSFEEIQKQGTALEDITPFGLIGTQQEVYDASKSKEAYNKFIINRNNKFDNEINQLKQELERVEGPEGFGALKPIYNFYENTVTNILNKTYGKENVKLITDEYGNTWNEISITPELKKQQILLQKTKSALPKVAPDNIVKLSKELLTKMGVNFEIAKNIVVNGVKLDANGVADMTRNLVQVVEGKEAQALPEEAMHFAVEIIEQTNPKLFNRMLADINDYKIYKQVIAEYSRNPNYQLPDGKPDIRKLKKEAIAKQLVNTIIEKTEGVETGPLIAKSEGWWNQIIEFIRNLFVSSGFDQAAMGIISGRFNGTVEDIRKTQEVISSNQIFLQKESEKYTSEEITNSLTSKDKPNERKFNRPTNLPESFKLVHGSITPSGFNPLGVNELSGILRGDSWMDRFGKKQDIPYIKGTFGRSFKDILLQKRGTDLETKKRYSVLRVIQSINDSELFMGILRRLGVDEIRVIDDLRYTSMFVSQGNLYINESAWLNNLESKINTANLDEYVNFAVFEELIHLIAKKITTNQEFVEASSELSKESSLIIDSFYKDNKSPSTLTKDISLINEVIRMKVQKDLGGRSTEDVVNRIVTKIWDFIINLFKNKLLSSSKIAENVKDFILNKENVNINTSIDNDILGLPNSSPQDGLFNKLKQVQSTIEKKEDGYYIDGKKVPRRVSDLVKDWYERRFREKQLTSSEYDKAVNDLKAEKGTDGHADIEHAFEVYVDADGFLRESPLDDSGYVSQLNPKDNSMYTLLKNNLRERLHSYPAGTRFLSEITVHDPKRQLAGTIDFLAITPDGKVNILDWKFMDLNTTKYTDIPWYKVNAWNQQMEQYKLILEKVYGVKSQDFQQTRMIPIKAFYGAGNRKENKLPVLQSIQIGDVNVKNIQEDYLLPVGLEGEKTGNKKIDALLEKLNAVYQKFSDKKVLPSEKLSKAEQLNTLYTAIRQLQIKGNIKPLLYQAQILNKQIQKTIDDYNKNWNGKPVSGFSQADINAFYEEIETAQNSLQHYTTLDTDLKFLFQGELSQEDKELKEKLRDTVDNARDLQSTLFEIGNEFTSDFVAGSEGVNNLLSPEKIIKGVTRWFSSTATLQLKSLEVLYKKANKAFGYASMDTLDETKKLQKIKEGYEKWASSKGLSKKDYFKAIKKAGKNELIDEYKPEFYKTLREKIAENDVAWVKANIDKSEYAKLLGEKIVTEIQRVNDKARIGTEEEIDGQIRKEIADVKRLYNISQIDSPGWFLYDLLKQVPLKEKWETQEWKDLHKAENSPALEFYNYIIERNTYYQEIGYINKAEARVFLPFVRKGLMEKLIMGGNITLGEQFLRSVSIDAGDVGYGQIDPLTGRPIDKIPVYFTREIDGELSEDLFRNMALYNEMAIRYKYVSDIEAQARALINVERNKKAIATSIFGKTVYKDGKLEYTPDNNDNTKLVEDMVKGIIYGQRYIQSETFDQILGSIGGFGKKANDKLGVKIFPENLEGRQLSVNKALTQLNNTFQLNALGLNPLSALSNLLGGSFQSIINSEKYFTRADFSSAELWLLANKMTGKDQKKMIGALEYFLPLTDNYNAQLAKTLSLSKLSQENVQEFLMILMRKSDWFVQTANFYAFLNNSIVQDGKVVNVREYLRSQPEYQDMFSGTTETRKAKRAKFEKDVASLKAEKGVLVLGKVENGEFVIPGVDRKSDSVIELRRKVQQVSKDALGNLSEDDLRAINMNIYGKSFMLFKNWIPRLVDVRLGNLKYNSASDAYEWGRARMVFRLLTQDLVKSLDSLGNAITGDGEKWVAQMKDLYETKKVEYETETGKTLEMTEDEFISLTRKNVRAQLVDTLFMATLFSFFLGLKALAPDDDEDEYVKNNYRFMLRAVDKIKDELAYFYDPTSLTSMVSTGIFPSVAYINNLKKVVVNFGKENYALFMDDEEALKKNYVIKYIMKSFPISNQATQMLPMFYPELSKELGLRMQSEAKPPR